MLNEYMKRIKKTDYDRRNDILYIIFSNDHGNSYCEEKTIGIEAMRDIDTDELTGFMIYYPQRKYIERQRELKEIGYDFDLMVACK